MNVSTLILTHNEAANLPACLAALAWCKDVVVLDSGSTDATVEIAVRHGARVMTRPFDNFASQRNHGLEYGALRNDWVLHLDADEILTPAFVRALDELDPPAEIDAYSVPSKLMLFGHWLRHAGMYPAYQVRIGRRDRLRFKQVGHGQREDLPPERMRVFPEPYLHYSFSQGMRRWLEKHVRYAADEADLLVAERQQNIQRPAFSSRGDPIQHRRWARQRAGRIPLYLRAPARFVYIYIYCQGFRDGRAGLVYALMMSVYEGMIAVCSYERMLGPLSDSRAPSAVQKIVAD